MLTFSQEYIKYIDGLMQDCSISIANTLKKVLSCTKPLNDICLKFMWDICSAYCSMVALILN